MKIVEATVTPLRLPLERAYSSIGGSTVDANWVILARIRTDEGVTGYGFVVMLHAKFVQAIVAASRDLASVLVGRNVLDTESAWEAMIKSGSWVGPGGILHWAAAPLDIAMWDAAGKTIGKPVYRLLGGYSNKVETYATDGFTYDLSIDELQKRAKQVTDEGFSALKFRVKPSRRASEERERFEALRAAAGPDMRIMVECAQHFEVPQALETGKALSEAGAHWIEDPIYHKDFEGLAELSRRLGSPIAAGENLYELRDFVRLFRERCVGFPIIDIGRIGGITPWKRVAALAQAYGFRVSGHVLTEIHIHLLAAIPNAYLLEYAPRSQQILKNTLVLDKGKLTVPDVPGLGLDIDEDAVARFAQA